MKDFSRSKLTLTLLILTLLSFSLAYNSYDYSNAAVTGDQLKNLIIDKQDKIIVTLWFKHIENDKEHNKRNSITESSLRRLISRCHADVIYTEADLSDYNHNEGTYAKIANEWRIDLNELKHGPLVMVVYQQRGEMFWGTYDSMLINLIKRVDTYIRKIENRDFGREAPQCTVRLDYQELDEYYKNDPWVKYNGGSGSSGSSGSGSSGSSSYGSSSGSGSGSSGSGSSYSSGSGSSYNSISQSGTGSSSGSSTSGSTSGTSGSTSGTSGSTSGTSGSTSGTSGSTSGTSGSTSGTSGSTSGTSGSTSGTSGSTTGTSSTSTTSGGTSDTSTTTKPKLSLSEPSKAFMN